MVCLHSRVVKLFYSMQVCTEIDEIGLGRTHQILFHFRGEMDSIAIHASELIKSKMLKDSAILQYCNVCILIGYWILKNKQKQKNTTFSKRLVSFMPVLFQRDFVFQKDKIYTKKLASHLQHIFFYNGNISSSCKIYCLESAHKQQKSKNQETWLLSISRTYVQPLQGRSALRLI